MLYNSQMHAVLKMRKNKSVLCGQTVVQ